VCRRTGGERPVPAHATIGALASSIWTMVGTSHYEGPTFAN